MARTGRPQRIIKTFLGIYPSAENGRVQIDLPRDYDYTSIMVRFAVTANVTAAATSVRIDAPHGAVRFISLKANGKDLLDSLPGVIAPKLGVFRRGQLPLATPPSGVAVASYGADGVFILDRAVIDGVRPKDGNFPSRGLSTFQLELTAGSFSDLFIGGAGNLTNFAYEITLVRTIEIADSSGKISLPSVVTKRTETSIPFPATATNYQHRLNTGNGLRGVIIRTSGFVNPGEPTDNILNGIKIQRSNEVLIDLTGAALRRMNQADYNVTTIPTGFYFVDFMGYGGPANRLADCLDLSGGDEIFLYINVIGGPNIVVSVTQLEYMPYVPAQWGIMS